MSLTILKRRVGKRMIAMVLIGTAIFIAITILVVVIVYCLKAYWPIDYVERKRQRSEVVSKIGTGESLRKACMSLCEISEGFVWHKGVHYEGFNIELPEAIMVLDPLEIIRVMGDSANAADKYQKMSYVRIQLHGAHSTGGNSTPYYGLVIPCDSGPAITQKQISGLRYFDGRAYLLKEGIYEFY